MKWLKEGFKFYKNDIPSGIVVYFVALPLCLAIAQVSTGSSELVFSGIIAGVIGGIVIGALSGSSLGVSGPAAGLVVIVFNGIQELSVNGDTYAGYRMFLLALVFAGIIQLVAGYLKAGIIGNYFPSAVIKGMLSAIGITIILKEFPHILGYDKDFMGDEAFDQADGQNTFTEIYYAVKYHSSGAVIISMASVALLLICEIKKVAALKIFRFIPSALFVVIFGVLINQILPEELRLKGEHLVQLPVANSISEFSGFFISPDFSAWNNPAIYKLAFTLAIIASLETLLSLEATDKLDPEKRKTSPDRELKAQGIGNMISGLLGGLPVTQVIVRSSANINSGGKTKLATIIHGSILLITAVSIPNIINTIPLAVLASILVLIGYKLTKISLIRQMYRQGADQFIPFAVTVIAILSTDLLRGIAIGIGTAFLFIIRAGYKNAYNAYNEDLEKDNILHIELADQVSFLNKGVILNTLNELDNGYTVIIDGSRSKYIDPDVLEVIYEFERYGSKAKGIKVELIKIPEPEASSIH